MIVSSNLNDFGNFMRSYRIKKGMLLYHMAMKLDCQSHFLSGCETGNKLIPEYWKELIPKKYPDIDSDELIRLIDKSNKEFKI